MFNELPGSAQGAFQIYRIYETNLILRSLKSYFSYPKNQYLTILKVNVVFKFKEALLF